MNLSDFRARILNAVQASRTLHPDTHLHLLYAPELGDPLRLVDLPGQFRTRSF